MNPKSDSVKDFISKHLQESQYKECPFRIKFPEGEFCHFTINPESCGKWDGKTEGYDGKRAYFRCRL